MLCGLHVSIWDVWEGTRAFVMLPAPPPADYFPFRALTHKDCPNLLLAGKTISQTFYANAATREHPECVARASVPLGLPFYDLLSCACTGLWASVRAGSACVCICVSPLAGVCICLPLSLACVGMSLLVGVFICLPLLCCREWSSGVAAGGAAALMFQQGWASTSQVLANVHTLQDALSAPPLQQPLTWKLS